jgi:hypothetical protein
MLSCKGLIVADQKKNPGTFLLFASETEEATILEDNLSRFLNL